MELKCGLGYFVELEPGLGYFRVLSAGHTVDIIYNSPLITEKP
jgi:hypothetical protein